MERVFGLTSVAKKHYKELDGKAALCKKCQKCIERCPQNLDIPFWLDKVVETLDDDAESSRKDNQKQEAD
jgi:predicted aldo/keto reductase-like oxidoreductase